MNALANLETGITNEELQRNVDIAKVNANLEQSDITNQLKANELRLMAKAAKLNALGKGTEQLGAYAGNKRLESVYRNLASSLSGGYYKVGKNGRMYFAGAPTDEEESN
jgi:hypothetical protein